MRFFILLLLGLCSVNLTVTGFADDQLQTDINELRTALNDLRLEYIANIQALEKRVAAAEAQAYQAASAPAPAPTGNSVGGGNAFNPAIGVIFQGLAWDRASNSQNLPGFPLGGEAGPISRGLSLGETEIDISASVDDKFRAWLTLPVSLEDREAHIEIEEAWIETMALPAGLSLRVGRMFSGIGYLNSKHAHTWDFIDQPLAYQAFLGDQYLDDGVQMRWLAPSDLYLELGAEVLRGARYPAAGALNSGFGTRTIFAHTGGDAGDSSSWLAGMSYLRTSSKLRESSDGDQPLFFDGDTELIIADFVWKWAPYGNWKQKNFKLQGEYIWRREVGDFQLPDTRLLAYNEKQKGWYMQAIYQPIPQWRLGIRYDKVSAHNPGVTFIGTPLDTLGLNPDRVSFMVDWSNSEFSRVRFQYTHDSASLPSDNQWGLQYIFSIGAHGAHEF